ncbi:PadR family transcriptional regulator [Paractinoplanes atraurantiacus]|uniref:Transcriptional regulator PadR-like family protein n=1 Tax=Paractinoplanes atraurantiacus TaxID=1036182 RepID=A0A285HRP5_9ACTN|nr:helix-turn-helix transcriptional regulator [Actinoplanes atraurantiacus]SNY38335.1 Transcriptional regulator PadR-like family protein [Actinoplanes atraurantiacus]
MSTTPRLTPQTVAVIRALLEDPAKPRWGRDIAAETGLKSGTLHPILARLEHAGWVESTWEDPADHEDKGRPRRRYYRFTPHSAEQARLALATHTATGDASSAPRLRPQPGY